MGDAASEMHLLREAEAQLGAAIWEKTENIEALSVEYWNLRKLIRERDDVRERLISCQERLDQAHAERSDLLNTTTDDNEDLLEERTGLLAGLEELARQRDHIVAEAREVRRAYVGLKMKLEVLTEESRGSVMDPAEIARVRARLIGLKVRFSELKQQRIVIGRKIEADDALVDVVDEKIKKVRTERRSRASEAFQIIGEGNKEISILRAESGVLDTRMRQLYGEIGRHVSRNAAIDPACAAAVGKHQGLVDVMFALRRSIALNHRLAGNA